MNITEDFLRSFTIEFNETIVNYIFNSLNKALDRLNITGDFFDLLPLNLMKLLSIIYLTASIKFLTGEYYRKFLQPFTIEFNETIVNYIFNSLNKVLDR